MRKRVALVTGSARGLGVQAVLALAKEGHDVVINYRKSADHALAIKNQAEQFGVRCMTVQGDVSIKEDCQNIVKEVLQHFGYLDILVNNAGPYIFERKKMVDYTHEEWELLVNGNLNAVFYLAKEVVPMMRQQQWGRIINFGFNQAGQATGWENRTAFAASKVGLVSLTKSLAQEESEEGITVNMICPGDIVGTNKEKTISEVKGDQKNIAPVGRSGSGEDIARVVSFLCAEDSDFITGSIIEVNGGLNVTGKRK